MKERIGIVLEKRSDDGRFLGQLIDIDISLKINEKSCIEVCKNIKKEAFFLDPISQIFTTFPETRFEVAKEIAKELRKIGFEDIKFDFCDELYDADGEEI